MVMEERKMTITVEPAVGTQSGVPDGVDKAPSSTVDHLALDLRICFFMAALKSLKRHTQLKFPALLRNREGEQDDAYFDRLVCKSQGILWPRPSCQPVVLFVSLAASYFPRLRLRETYLRLMRSPVPTT
jgi:hypothetical protein